uniref:Single stranded DNA binding protein 4 n=1 Tax=Terrapene triunguis TaxID=2587831 RepID=A0A674JAQ1_9SAUR
MKEFPSKLALYVYEYLLHVGAQKSAQTFLSEIRWEKNITLGEPPGFLHSWWCVFWDLYCAAPDRRETCEHSSEAKAFHDYSAAAAPSPVMGNMPPNDGMPGGPMPPGFFQGPPGSQPSPHAQPPPHNPAAPMLGPHSQVRPSGASRPTAPQQAGPGEEACRPQCAHPPHKPLSPPLPAYSPTLRGVAHLRLWGLLRPGGWADVATDPWRSPGVPQPPVCTPLHAATHSPGLCPVPGRFPFSGPSHHPRARAQHGPPGQAGSELHFPCALPRAAARPTPLRPVGTAQWVRAGPRSSALPWHPPSPSWEIGASRDPQPSPPAPSHADTCPSQA